MLAALLHTAKLNKPPAAPVQRCQQWPTPSLQRLRHHDAKRCDHYYWMYIEQSAGIVASCRQLRRAPRQPACDCSELSNLLARTALETGEGQAGACIAESVAM